MKVFRPSGPPPAPPHLVGTCLLGLIFLFLMGTPARAQGVDVTASVNSTRVTTSEPVVYTLQIEGASLSDLRTPAPPETEGLVLVQRIPSTSRQISLIGGRMTQSISYSWTYRPIREGKAHIASTELVIKDKHFTTAAIDVDVVGQGTPQANNAQPGRSGSGRAEISDDDLFIRVAPSDDTAYQNEQVTVEYVLYFRDGIQLRHSRLAGSWDAEGFWREEFDVDARPTPRATVLNGLRYNTITLKRVAVFPTHAGELEIDPLRIESEAYVPFRSNDPFDQFFSLRSRFNTVELTSPAVKVHARALPPGKPASFGGAVGRFTFSTRVDQRHVDVGQPIQLELKITGSGNIATLEPPAFTVPGIFEQYDPDVSTTIGRSGAEITGTKRFTYVLVPRSNGSFQIPRVAFSFFDPSSAQYETVRSDPVTVVVTGTASAPVAATTTASGLPVDDIAGLLDAPSAWQRVASVPLYRRPWVYAALLLPLLVLGGVFGYRRHATRLATDADYARSRMAHPVARKHLKQAQALLQADEPHAFYEELERAVLGFIGNSMNVAELGFTRDRLDGRLAAAGVSAEARDDLRMLLDTCDRARFSPERPDRRTMLDDRDRAARLIVAIDEAVKAQEVSVAT